MHLKMSSAKWRPFSLGLNVSTHPGRVMPIWVKYTGPPFGCPCSTPNHFWNRFWHMFNLAFWNKCQENMNQNTSKFVQGNKLKPGIVCNNDLLCQKFNVLNLIIYPLYISLVVKYLYDVHTYMKSYLKMSSLPYIVRIKDQIMSTIIYYISNIKVFGVTAQLY